MTSLRSLLVGVLVVGAAVAASVVPGRADHLSGVTVIVAEQLKGWIDGGKPMLLVDSRVSAEYKAGHIPTAVNIVATTMDKEHAKLPGNKKATLVFYCNGWPECKKSHDASAKAVEWGYQNVYWLREGIPAWQAKGYPVE